MKVLQGFASRFVSGLVNDAVTSSRWILKKEIICVSHVVNPSKRASCFIHTVHKFTCEVCNELFTQLSQLTKHQTLRDKTQ